MGDVEADLKASKRVTPGSLVFCQEDGSPLTIWHLHGALERAAKRANLRLLRWHDRRHTFASNLVAGTSRYGRSKFGWATAPRFCRPLAMKEARTRTWTKLPSMATRRSLSCIERDRARASPTD